MKKLRIGICGWGNIATGLYDALHSDSLQQLDDLNISIDCIGARRDNPICDYGDTPIFRDIFDIPDQDVDVVVELIGGVEVARELILKAINNGKHIITANKAVIFHHGDEIFQAARDNEVQVLIEASVCAGTPVVKLIKNELAGNNISKVSGMLNGTSNFILSSMEKGMDFDEALSIAKKEGYAEPDPSFDIDGMDAAHKIGILSHLAYGSSLPPKEFHIEGISNISKLDFKYASINNLALKHLAVAKMREGSVEIRVHPVFLDKKSSLASLHGVRNGIEIDTDLVGKVYLAGSGAGRESTASGLISDLIAIGRSLDNNIAAISHSLNVAITDFDLAVFKYYFYLEVSDEPDIANAINSCFADNNVSVENFLQEDATKDQQAPIMITTGLVNEKNAQVLLDSLSRFSFVTSVRLIRIEAD